MTKNKNKKWRIRNIYFSLRKKSFLYTHFFIRMQKKLYKFLKSQNFPGFRIHYDNNEFKHYRKNSSLCRCLLDFGRSLDIILSIREIIDNLQEKKLLSKQVNKNYIKTLKN